jgi:hypothetical protein
MEVVGEKRSRSSAEREDIFEAVDRNMQPKKRHIVQSTETEPAQPDPETKPMDATDGQTEQPDPETEPMDATDGQTEQPDPETEPMDATDGQTEQPEPATEQEPPKPETDQEKPNPETEQSTSKQEEPETEETETPEEKRIRIYRNTVPDKSAEAQLEYIRSRFIGKADRHIDLVEWGLMQIYEDRELGIPNGQAPDSSELVYYTLRELQSRWLVFHLARCETHAEASRFDFEFNPNALLRVLFGDQWSQHHIKPRKLCFFRNSDHCEMLPDDTPPANLVGKLLLFPPPAGDPEGGDVHFPDIYRVTSPLNQYLHGGRELKVPRHETIMPYIYFRSDLKCTIDPLTKGSRFVLVYDVLSGSAPSASTVTASPVKARKWPADDNHQIAAELYKQFGDKPNVYVDDDSFSGWVIMELGKIFPLKCVGSEVGLDRPKIVYSDIDDSWTSLLSFEERIKRKTKAYNVQHYLAGPDYVANQHVSLPYIPKRPAIKPLHRGSLLNPRGGTRGKRYTAPDGAYDS